MTDMPLIRASLLETIYMTIHRHEGDLQSPDLFSELVAVDTETMGLDLQRDRLCVVQLSVGDGDAHVVRLQGPEYDCPNLKALLSDVKITKIFHFARFDVAMLKKWLDIDCGPVFCTKIASKLVRTYTDRHGLKDLSRELLSVDMSKAQQSSDWGALSLTDAQYEYAASDVLHLHKLRERLIEMLEREDRMDLAQACFDFLPHRAALDLAGWDEVDIFAHS